jgi:hypothetical protein
VEDAIEGEKFRDELQAISEKNGQERCTKEVSYPETLESGQTMAYMYPNKPWRSWRPITTSHPRRRRRRRRRRRYDT